MPLSCKIIKDLKCNENRTLLEIRHSFIEENCYDEDVSELESDSASQDIIAIAEQKAKRLLDYATKEAELLRYTIRKKAQDEAEIIKSAAYQEALEKGQREAIESAAKDAQLIREQAHMVLQQAEEVRKQAIESLEQNIVDLAIEIAEKVLNTKLKMEPQVVVDLAAESIKMLKERDKVVLMVNPDEAIYYEAKKNELLKELSPKGELHIIADHDIEPGGCVVETDYGYVDAQLKKRWQTLIDNLGSKG